MNDLVRPSLYQAEHEVPCNESLHNPETLILLGQSAKQETGWQKIKVFQ